MILNHDDGIGGRRSKRIMRMRMRMGMLMVVVVVVMITIHV